MIPLFLGLSAFNWLMLAVTTWLGFAQSAKAPVGEHHVMLGALATIACCAVHCSVFTYFIATAKWIQQAVISRQLDPALLAPTRSFKMQAFPAALLAMASVFAAAVAGAIVANYPVAPAWHLVVAMLALAINVLVTCVEYSAIQRNGKLIDTILAALPVR